MERVSNNGKSQSQRKLSRNSAGDFEVSPARISTISSRNACCTGSRYARGSSQSEKGPQSPICHRFFTDYVREKAADKRGGEQELLSLDAPVDGSDDGLTLGDLIADTTIADSGDAVGSTRHHTELDVARALEQLTPMQRKQ